MIGDGVLQRMMAKVVMNYPTGCWEYCGCRFKKGYGNIRVGGKSGKNRGTHRVSYELHIGPIPDGLLVMHSCDNPPCVNPDHLSVGTVADNVADMDAKGRRVIATGDRHGSKTHPEMIPRGLRHGRYTKPEATARGDRHFSVTSPEKIPRGDRHWSKVSPEKIPRGSKVHHAKLTEGSVVEIESRILSGETVSSVARAFGVSRRTIRFIMIGHTWTHVPRRSANV
jgi:hypothetical protein